MFSNAQITPLAETGDDVISLSQTFALSKINYVDIAMQEQLPHIFARWPLLAELAAAQDFMSSPMTSQNLPIQE